MCRNVILPILFCCFASYLLAAEDLMSADVAAPAAPMPPTCPILTAVSASPAQVELGAVYPDIKRSNDPNRYKFKVLLTSRGAAAQRAWLSEFDDRNINSLAPLPMLFELADERGLILPLAEPALRYALEDQNTFAHQFPLEKLHWRLLPTETADTAAFEAILTDQTNGKPVLKLTKTYSVAPANYDLLCRWEIENLSALALKVQLVLRGPAGLTKEDAREDTRKVFVAYRQNGRIITRLMPATDVRALEQEKIEPSTGFLSQLRNLFGKQTPPEVKLALDAHKGLQMVWTALTNKYFAAVWRPVVEPLEAPAGVRFVRAAFYDSQLMARSPAPNAGAAPLVETEVIPLAPAGAEKDRWQMTVALFMGPKDKSLFEANAVYDALDYFQTIDFRGCCCPASLIGPLAFGIMWLMKTMYTLMGPLGNYGIVIMILVFVVRLILHPVTKHSQVSMMKMQKLGPKIQQIQQKYANDRQEMNRQMMELYRQMGVSPISGMLPMFLQMPIWIALWTAVYTSVDLRGQGFLPFWMTDLSAPDHLFKFPFGLELPFFGAYFNLLPILMGVVMYAQQKMMPPSTTPPVNQQAAQQQKMMMIMMPILFPLLLYHGPSGVNLYIMSSIGAGVIEQMVIRKHIQERERLEAESTVPATAKTGGKPKKKKPKPLFKWYKT